MATAKRAKSNLGFRHVKAAVKSGKDAMKQTSQRSLLFRQNVNRTEAEKYFLT